MKQLRIAIYGNINNSPLRLAEGIRYLGHDVHLFVNRKEILHRPESLYPSWIGAFPSWIHDVSDVSDEDIAYESPRLFGLLDRLNDNYDLSILNDSGPALACYLKAPHAVALTGSDVSYYANFSTILVRTNCWANHFKRSTSGRADIIRWTNLIAKQRDGIASARLVIHPVRGLVPSNDDLLHCLGIDDEARLELWPSATNQLEFTPQPNNNPLRIFSPSRVNITIGSSGFMSAQDIKGTDILIRGFYEYCQRGGKGQLHLIKKGENIEHARQYISDLNISNKVIWHDEMTTSRLRDEMKKFDLICDQFTATPSGLITSDAYAMGRPVMANFSREKFPNRFPEPLPGFNATTPEEISDHLIAIEKNPAVLETVGAQSRAYAEEYLSPQIMASKLLQAFFRNTP
jgi:glycosyltransferase involved in cell wall biosynthesis